jgi:hypothetical protein
MNVQYRRAAASNPHRHPRTFPRWLERKNCRKLIIAGDTASRGVAGPAPNSTAYRNEGIGRIWLVWSWSKLTVRSTTRQQRSSAITSPRRNMRGDNLARRRAIALDCGSPPHARGQRGNLQCVLFRRRFTPTCAALVVARYVVGLGGTAMAEGDRLKALVRQLAEAAVEANQ